MTNLFLNLTALAGENGTVTHASLGKSGISIDFTTENGEIFSLFCCKSKTEDEEDNGDT